MAITIFFVLAGMFALTIKYSDVKKNAEMLRMEDSMHLVSKIANSPEFSCGRGFGSDRTNCIDSDKVMALKGNLSGKYKNFWGNISNIEIRKISSGSNKLCNMTNYPDCDIIRLFDKEVQGADTSNFVSLCRKEVYESESYDQCDVAKVMISYNLL